MTFQGGAIVLSVALALAAAPAAAADTAAMRPNVVVLMVDDLDVVSFQAARRAGFLPHLDRLFDLGTTFRESFVVESLCCPSRATYLTGLYPHNHGVIRNEGPYGGFPAFMREFAENNLAAWVQASGYHTAYVGKYLNGYVNWKLVPPGWEEWRALLDPTTYCMYGFLMSHDGALAGYGRHPERDYQTDVLAGLTEELIRARKARGEVRPLFLSIGTSAPHSEWGCYDGIRPAPRHAHSRALAMARPPSFNEADMSDKPTWMRELPLVDEGAMARLYNERLVALRAVDDLFGRTVRALEQAGELGRTAFLFTSDNGYLLGRHRYEAKALLYEESIRVPLLLRVPGRTGPTATDDIALNTDLAPTIAALTGAPAGLTVDGRSLLAVLDGEAATWRRRFLVEFPPQPPWAWPDRPPGVPSYFAVRTGPDGSLSDLMYAETLAGDGTTVTDRELYDLAPRADPYQVDSRHADLAYLFKRLRLKNHLDALKTCGAGACQTLEE
jgi:N-acetylglucosamine-6-sulfatase